MKVKMKVEEIENKNENEEIEDENQDEGQMEIKIILPPNQFRYSICLDTVIKDGVGSIKKGKQ